jgi:hypothetical protein
MSHENIEVPPLLALETTDLEESQVRIPVTDPSEEWEIRNVVGRKTVGGEVTW